MQKRGECKKKEGNAKKRKMQEEENAKSVADVVVCALVEDAEGVEKDPAHVLPTSESRTRKLD